MSREVPLHSCPEVPLPSQAPTVRCLLCRRLHPPEIPAGQEQKTELFSTEKAVLLPFLWIRSAPVLTLPNQTMLEAAPSIIWPYHRWEAEGGRGGGGRLAYGHPARSGIILDLLAWGFQLEMQAAAAH